MDWLRLVILFFISAKLAHICWQKRVYANDVFLLTGGVILYVILQRIPDHKEGFTAGLEGVALNNLNCLLKELYNDGILSIPGDVHIKGDLLVGTYQDENGVEKGWGDSIEHTCVWKPKINGADTTGPGWLGDTTRPDLANHAKPALGGGVFSFRAGHADLHPICLSRKQPRSTDTITTDRANTVGINDYRSWNPTFSDTILFAALHEVKLQTGPTPKNRCAQLHAINIVKAHWGVFWDMQIAYIYNYVDRGWITFKDYCYCESNFAVGGWADFRSAVKMLAIKEGGTDSNNNTTFENRTPGDATRGWIAQDTNRSMRLSN
jgi:hypothetical protein